MLKRFFCCLALLSLFSGCKTTQLKRPHNFHKVPKEPHKGATVYLAVKKKKKKAKVAIISPTPKQRADWWKSSPKVRKLRQQIVRIAQQGLGKKRIRCGANLQMRKDCSGWVRCVYSRLRLDLQQFPFAGRGNGVIRMYRYTKLYGKYHKQTLPFPGDLVFWHYTYDKSKNGKLDDKWTHIGIVEKIQPNGRIAIIHYSKGIKRVYMNLQQPKVWRQSIASNMSKRHQMICSRQQELYNYCLQKYSKKSCKQRKLYTKVVCKRLKRTKKLVFNSYLVSKRKRGRIFGSLTGELFGGFGTILRLPLPRHLSPSRKPQLLGKQRTQDVKKLRKDMKNLKKLLSSLKK